MVCGKEPKSGEGTIFWYGISPLWYDLGLSGLFCFSCKWMYLLAVGSFCSGKKAKCSIQATHPYYFRGHVVGKKLEPKTFSPAHFHDFCWLGIFFFTNLIDCNLWAHVRSINSHHRWVRAGIILCHVASECISAQARDLHCRLLGFQRVVAVCVDKNSLNHWTFFILLSILAQWTVYPWEFSRQQWCLSSLRNRA